MEKKTFKAILKEVPKPKKLTLETRLSYVFDLYWDVKTYRELLYRGGPTSEQLRLLREDGYDTTDLPILE